MSLTKTKFYHDIRTGAPWARRYNLIMGLVLAAMAITSIWTDHWVSAVFAFIGLLSATSYSRQLHKLRSQP